MYDNLDLDKVSTMCMSYQEFIRFLGLFVQTYNKWSLSLEHKTEDRHRHRVESFLYYCGVCEHRT